MNMTETKQLMEEISAIDGRKLTPETVAAWQGILCNIPLDIASEAHKLARRDDRINYLEPRHIVSWAKEAAYKLDRDAPKEKIEFKGTPMPICKEHGVGLLTCDPCCHRLYKYEEARGVDTLHDFARREIYA
jgi:hypothetical protein